MMTGIGGDVILTWRTGAGDMRMIGVMAGMTITTDTMTEIRPGDRLIEHSMGIGESGETRDLIRRRLA